MLLLNKKSVIMIIISRGYGGRDILQWISNADGNSVTNFILPIIFTSEGRYRLVSVQLPRQNLCWLASNILTSRTSPCQIT